jgi:small subunit ribosomal protein S17
LNRESEMENQEQGAAEERGRRKTRVGTVISDKMEKTVVVSVERRYAHPLYGKQVTRSKKYHAHDEGNEAKAGDLVRIVETRPLSKTKRWRVEEVVEKAK